MAQPMAQPMYAQQPMYAPAPVIQPVVAAPVVQPVMMPAAQAPAPVMMSAQPGPNAIVTTCPGCTQKVQTRIDKKLGTTAWIWVGVLFCFGCWSCYLYPFVMDS